MATPHRAQFSTPDIQNSAGNSGHQETTITFLTNLLFDALVHRKIENGKRIILEHEKFLKSVSADDQDAPRLHFVLAGWAEYSRIAVETTRRLREAYQQARPNLSLKAWGWIEAGNVSLALYENDWERLSAACNWVRGNCSRFNPSGELLAIVDLAQGRLTKRRGEYAAALELVQSAIGQYARAELPGMVAVSRVTEGWLLMQRGDLETSGEVWAKAHSFLNHTEDYTALSNMRFGEARHFCRSGKEKEALKAFQESDEMHSKFAPNHRTRRRVLIEWANLELRIAVKISHVDLDCANTLRKSAADHIRQAKELLQEDPDDHRNWVRLYLAQANDAMKGARRSLVNARNCSRKAYELAKQHQNTLMMARARLKQAKIESGEKEASDRIRMFVRAAQFSTEALELSRQVQSDRLAARVHTFRGNLFFDYPFRDVEQASMECEKAKECMQGHQDVDYVVEAIRALEKKLKTDTWAPKKL